MSAALDYAAGGEAGYSGVLPGDMTDTAHIAPYVQTGNGQAWWESLIQYGVTRAIDNRLGPQNIAGNTNAGTYAGQNGRTYVNAPNAAGGLAAPSVGGLPLWAVLAGAALVGYLAIRG